jgi:hypothetical protein
MKTTEEDAMNKKMIGAAVLAGGLGLTAAPAWSGGEGEHESITGESQTLSPGAYSSGSMVLSQSDMRDVERNLDSLGLDPGPVDGIIDSRTQSAISEFQMENELPVTGTVNNETMQELRTAANNEGGEHQRDDRSGWLEDGNDNRNESSS